MGIDNSIHLRGNIMSIYDYNYTCTGCGSGTSCTYIIKRDNVQINAGSLQVSSPCTDLSKRNAIVAREPYGANDTAFANGVQFYPTSGGISSVIIFIVALIAVYYFIVRRI